MLSSFSEIAKRCAYGAFRPIGKMPALFVFLFLLGGVCVAFEPWNSKRLYAVGELLLDVYALCLCLMLLPRKWARGVGGVLAVLLYVIAFLDNVLYVSVGSPLSASLLRAIVQTNATEASEAIHAFGNSRVWLSHVWLIPLLGCVHLWVVFHQRARARLRHFLLRFRWGVLPLLVCVLFLSSTNKRYLFHRLVCGQSDTQLPQSIMDATIRTGYYLPVYRFWEACIALARDSRAVMQVTRATLQAVPDSCSHLTPEIVLILGESYNRHHSALYGYPFPTTPYTSERARKGELVVFSDVITPWNFTTEALEHLFSVKCDTDSCNWYDGPLVTALLRRSGYVVSFLSNQYVLSPSKNLNGLIDTQLLNDTLLSRAQFTHRNGAIHTYDEALLRDYDSIAPYRSPYSFTIFHLHGQHVEFADRVPPRFDYFKENNYRRNDLTNEQRQVLADYDNATRYVDFVTDHLLRRLEERDVLVLFLADHGERVFDYATQTYGRTNSMSVADVRQQYEIPFWIWASPNYRRDYPEIWKKICAAANLPFMTDQVAQMLLYLSGCSTAYYSESNNPLSDDYMVRHERLLRGTMSYEKLLQSSPLVP